MGTLNASDIIVRVPPSTASACSPASPTSRAGWTIPDPKAHAAPNSAVRELIHDKEKLSGG